ncbi:MAG: glycosyl hydrolase family 17 protein [Candidatus Krumholzibacteria bacterium]|nr:glycosyl hydrolase family 17 protein [Candidatus Krumholzibacteria bacterium]
MSDSHATGSGLGIEFGNAICYSGYREGQSPLTRTYPSYDEIREDLRILDQHWQYLRLYDCTRHAELVLEVIRDEGLDLRVMLGADMRAEQSNPNCPWGAEFDEAQLIANRSANDEEIDRMIALANRCPDIVFAVSVGNEATVDWTDHMVPVERLLGFVRRIRQTVKQPVTLCDNHAPWIEKLAPLAAELDFISIHSYPVWEFHTVEGALEYTRQNYRAVADRYPGKTVIITEAGWTTKSNGRGIEPWNASEEFQAQYYGQLIDWSNERGVLTFVFEAFDEPWKGSPDPMEPEKHWGVFTVDRKPKLVMQELFAHMQPRRPTGKARR